MQFLLHLHPIILYFEHNYLDGLALGSTDIFNVLHHLDFTQHLDIIFNNPVVHHLNFSIATDPDKVKDISA
jgi:hypothetical protein